MNKTITATIECGRGGDSGGDNSGVFGYGGGNQGSDLDDEIPF